MIKTIFWDFDGVLMDSNIVRDQGFLEVLKEYPKEEVAQLMDFHQNNGGLSRYVKFRYFFEDIRKEAVTEEKIQELAQLFSAIMKKLLVKPSLLIQETIDFVKKNQGQYVMYITSGSDQKELRHLCKEMNINHFFKSIHGSPKPKKQWIKDLIQEHHYNPSECVIVGDSINDLEAATANDIFFIGFNNPQLKDKFVYFDSFNGIDEPLENYLKK